MIQGNACTVHVSKVKLLKARGIQMTSNSQVKKKKEKTTDMA